MKADLTAMKEEGVITSLAIVLMHSYAYTDQEVAIEKVAREVGFE